MGGRNAGRRVKFLPRDTQARIRCCGHQEDTMNAAVSPILIVEDNPIDLDLTRRVFERRKLVNPTQVARDGEEALALIQRWEEGQPVPIVILLDLKLPKVSGLEVLRELK